MPQKNNIKSYLSLHLIIFIWGFTAVLGALISLDALHIVWYRLLLALPFLLLWIKYRGRSLKISRKTVFHLSIGGLIIALHWVAFFKAIKVSNVSVTLVTMSTGAFFTSLLEPLFFKRRVIVLEVLFGFLIVGGLYLIFRVDNLHFYGMLWALLAAFLSALFTVINGLFIEKHKASVLSFYQLFFGVLAISVYLFFRGDISIQFFYLSTNDWIYLLLLASVCTAYAFTVSIDLMKSLSPYTIMLSINLEPIYGILLALLIFGEREKMSPTFYIGAFLIFGIVVLNSILKIKKS